LFFKFKIADKSITVFDQEIYAFYPRFTLFYAAIFKSITDKI